VTRTFRTVFTHVLASDSGVLVGSRDPIAFEPEVWVERLGTGEAYLGRDRAREVVEELLRLRPARGAIEGSLNRDLFPRDELAVGQ
jgi:hypothetical protein